MYRTHFFPVFLGAWIYLRLGPLFGSPFGSSDGSVRLLLVTLLLVTLLLVTLTGRSRDAHGTLTVTLTGTLLLVTLTEPSELPTGCQNGSKMDSNG